MTTAKEEAVSKWIGVHALALKNLLFGLAQNGVELTPNIRRLAADSLRLITYNLEDEIPEIEVSHEGTLVNDQSFEAATTVGNELTRIANEFDPENPS